MTPNVNAIRFNQVENNILKKINTLNEQFVKNILKSVDIKDIRYILSHLIRNLDNICLTCAKNFSRPLCLDSLLIFLLLLFNYKIEEAAIVFYSATLIGCLWALLIWVLLVSGPYPL